MPLLSNVRRSVRQPLGAGTNRAHRYRAYPTFPADGALMVHDVRLTNFRAQVDARSAELHERTKVSPCAQSFGSCDPSCACWKWCTFRRLTQEMASLEL
jgi:hypothetical protein